jgi:hypothetical protein
VLDGDVAVALARDNYGVAVITAEDNSLRVDLEETIRLRRAARA